MQCVCMKAVRMQLDVQLYHPGYPEYLEELNRWNLGVIV